MWRDFITTDSGVMMGEPVIAGSRVTVELVLDKLEAGETIEQITTEHSRLSEESVSAELRQ